MILREDVLPPEVYERQRLGLRAAMAAESRLRRVELRPGLHLYFESRQSLWFHLHELLHATSWNEAAIRQELSYVNQMVPAEWGLVATATGEVDTDFHAAQFIHGRWWLCLCGEPVGARDIPFGDGATALPGMRHLHFFVGPALATVLRMPRVEVSVCVEWRGQVHCVELSQGTRWAIALDLAAHSAVEAS
jgi:Protein of unknown function (DUF3501)